MYAFGFKLVEGSLPRVSRRRFVLVSPLVSDRTGCYSRPFSAPLAVVGVDIVCGRYLFRHLNVRLGSEMRPDPFVERRWFVALGSTGRVAHEFVSWPGGRRAVDFLLHSDAKGIAI